jgi:hypothetical protein
MIESIVKRLVATGVAAAIPNVTAGVVLDVEVWKAAVMSGAVAVLGVVQMLAVAYKDGDLTVAEIEEAFKD